MDIGDLFFLLLPLKLLLAAVLVVVIVVVTQKETKKAEARDPHEIHAALHPIEFTHVTDGVAAGYTPYATGTTLPAINFTEKDFNFYPEIHEGNTRAIHYARERHFGVLSTYTRTLETRQQIPSSLFATTLAPWDTTASTPGTVYDYLRPEHHVTIWNDLHATVGVFMTDRLDVTVDFVCFWGVKRLTEDSEEVSVFSFWRRSLLNGLELVQQRVVSQLVPRTGLPSRSTGVFTVVENQGATTSLKFVSTGLSPSGSPVLAVFDVTQEAVSEPDLVGLDHAATVHNIAASGNTLVVLYGKTQNDAHGLCSYRWDGLRLYMTEEIHPPVHNPIPDSALRELRTPWETHPLLLAMDAAGEQMFVKQDKLHLMYYRKHTTLGRWMQVSSLALRPDFPSSDAIGEFDVGEGQFSADGSLFMCHVSAGGSTRGEHATVLVWRYDLTNEDWNLDKASPHKIPFRQRLWQDHLALDVLRSHGVAHVVVPQDNTMTQYEWVL